MSAADRLDEIEARLGPVPSILMSWRVTKNDAQSMTAALRAVLAMHEEALTPYGELCRGCDDYPCPTVITITAALASEATS